MSFPWGFKLRGAGEVAVKKIVCLLALLAIFWGSGNGVLAVPIDNHYTVGATVTPVGGNSYKYFYDVANLGQGGGAPHGLDGFFIQVPHSATLSDLTDPVSWSPRGWWESRPYVAYHRHAA